MRSNWAPSPCYAASAASCEARCHWQLDAADDPIDAINAALDRLEHTRPLKPGPAVTIMDGSMGRELTLQGMPTDELFYQIWSARAIRDPELHPMVVEAHRAYIKAGAQAICTNSYGIQPGYYSRLEPEPAPDAAQSAVSLSASRKRSQARIARPRLGQLDWYALMIADAQTSAELAVQAREESGAAGAGVEVWGCLGPICESHRPDLFRRFVEAEGEAHVVDCYRELAVSLVRGGAEVLLLENLNCWEEAELALKAVETLELPVVLMMEGAMREDNLTPKPNKAAATARKAIRAKQAGARIRAFGFGCSEPENILGCLESIEAAQGLSKELSGNSIRLACHSNINDRKEVHNKGFDASNTKDPSLIKKREDLAGDDYAGYLEFCKQFVQHGATYVGGCCGCGPGGIERLVNELSH